MEEKRIVLHLEGVEGDPSIGRGWMATYLLDGEPDPKIISIFGTHILPTPFLEGTDEDTVLEAVRAGSTDGEVEIKTEAKTETVRSYWGMECPRCNSDDDLIITASFRVKLVKDGTEDACEGHEWSDESPTYCNCGFMGQVKDFTITKRIEISDCPQCGYPHSPGNCNPDA